MGDGILNYESSADDKTTNIEGNRFDTELVGTYKDEYQDKIARNMSTAGALFALQTIGKNIVLYIILPALEWFVKLII